MAGSFLETFQTNSGKVAINFPVPLTRLTWLRIEQQVDCFVGCFPGKRRTTSKQFVEYRAKSIDICRPADGRVVTYCLLRRHVAGRAHYFQ